MNFSHRVDPSTYQKGRSLMTGGHYAIWIMLQKLISIKGSRLSICLEYVTLCHLYKLRGCQSQSFDSEFEGMIFGVQLFFVSSQLGKHSDFSCESTHGQADSLQLSNRATEGHKFYGSKSLYTSMLLLRVCEVGIVAVLEFLQCDRLTSGFV